MEEVIMQYRELEGSKAGATPAGGDDSPSPEGGTNPRLYQAELAIDAANQAKLIQSVTVTKAAGQGFLIFLLFQQMPIQIVHLLYCRLFQG
jgi:hypothetical protein